MLLTFVVPQQSAQAEDIAHHHVCEVREDGVLHRQRDIVFNCAVLCVPDFEQGQAHIHSPDYECVVCGSLPDLHKVISVDRKMGSDVEASLLMLLPNG